MKISSLQPGDVLWETHSHRMGNTSMRSIGVYRVIIGEVDPDEKWFTASWNENGFRTYWFVPPKWRRKQPVTITDEFGRVRLAKRGEKP